MNGDDRYGRDVLAIPGSQATKFDLPIPGMVLLVKLIYHFEYI